MKKITLSENLERIQCGTFTNCKSLSSLSIPGSVKYILQYDDWDYGNIFYYTFEGCDSLREISFMYGASILKSGYLYKYFRDGNWESWTEQLEKVFIDRELEYDLTVPNLKELKVGEHIAKLQIVDIDKRDKLESIVSYAMTPPEVSNGFSNSQYINVIVKVPTKALETYQKNSTWGNFWNLQGFDVGEEYISISLDRSSFSMYAGDRSILIVTTEGYLSELTWTSSNPEVATVESDGTVRALAAGETTITVSATVLSTNKTVSATCLVKVEGKETYTLGGSFNDDNNTVTITSLSGKPLTVDIPEYMEADGRQYTVTGISASAFAGNRELRTITIPATVKEIAPGAFKGCFRLETVNYYPVSVNTQLSHQTTPVFVHCPVFKNLNIGETVNEIPKYMFKDTDIEKLLIPDNVKSLLNDCFAECDKLTEIRIGKGVSTIDCSSFALGECMGGKTKRAMLSEWLVVGSRDISVSYGVSV